ncbi:MAG: PAS domain S-box protein [Pseudomonadota bacterium]
MKELEKRIHELEQALLNHGEIEAGLQQELTELRRANAALKDSASHMRALLEAIPDLIWLKDPDGVYIACNSRFENFFGAKEADIVGRTDYGFVREDLADFFREKDKAALAADGPIIIEEEVEFADDGHKEILETIKTRIFDSGGNVIGVLGVGRDITGRKRNQELLQVLVQEKTRDLIKVNEALRAENEERKKAQKKHAETENQLMVHLQNTPMGVILLDQNFRITYWNPAAESIFGHTQNEALGNPIDFIVPEDVKKTVKTVFSDLLSGLGGEQNINDNITREGERIICSWYNTVLYNMEGAVTGFASLVNDITQQKAHEKQLLRFAKIIEQASEEVVITDRNGIIEYVNPSFEKNTGYSRDEAMGRTPAILKSGLHPRQFYKNIWATVLGRQIWKGTIKNKCKNGQILIHDMVITPILDSNNQISDFVSIRRDITEQSRMEQQAQQSRKMEAIGTLAGGIAHDFNNILSGIFGYAQLAVRNIHDPERSKRHIEQITMGARRAADLVQQILTFSRQTEQKKNPLHLYLIVKEAVKLLRASIPATIEIREKIYSQSRVLADSTQMYQIVMNLCTNAYHAMRETGGTLTVSLEEKKIPEPNSVSGITVKPGAYLNLEVGDTGTGMTQDILEKIFEPYFTTKQVNEGTGLGLAVVLGIIEKHNGHIKVSSEPGAGSVFSVFLPVFIPDAESHCPTTALNSPEPVSERVMMVDDDMSVLSSTREILEECGYKVMAFSRGDDALKCLLMDPSGIDLVITDMTMPQMTGYEHSCKALEIRRDLPIILCSGYSDVISEAMALKAGIRKFVQKPIESGDLLRMVRDVMDEK